MLCIVSFAMTCYCDEVCVSHLQAEPLQMQEDMLNTRRDEFENSIEKLTSWDGFLDALDRKKMVMTPWYAVHPPTVLCSSCMQNSG